MRSSNPSLSRCRPSPAGFDSRSPVAVRRIALWTWP
jgi:hypothetical protein